MLAKDLSQSAPLKAYDSTPPKNRKFKVLETALYDITSIPTVIIFESGEEKERFKANIMFQLDADKKIVQNSIDQIMISKFN